MTDHRPAPIEFAARGDAEEVGRAELYGLLSRLWLAPPDAALLEQFRVAVTEAPERGGHLEQPWQDLVAAMRATHVEQATAEFTALFQGVGKPEVFVFGSFYLTGVLNDRPLADLRTDLQTLGLGRDEGRMETEDHVSFVLEVMRYLIAGDDLGAGHLATQQRFFNTQLRPWADALWDALEAHPKSGFYRALAAFARDFFSVEAQAFDMTDA